MTGNMTGRVFNNRYQITERIGIGGMAEVYRAQDNVLGRMVAVKTMLPQYAADQNFTKRFKQEAAAAANLQSPYIVNVYDWGQDDGTYYIVMEFVRGSDLKTAINERGAINQRKVAEIGSQVCQALTVAHNLDIIHRDIKPQNIMVQPDGNVKVMDFGIARAKNSVMTQTSSVLGTAHYISPEQAQGKELTAASDIYSLGIVLYEAATGKLPFDGPDAVNVALQQVNDLPVPPCEVNPNIDPALEAIIMKAMAKNPMERFATAQDMRFALNDYLAGRPVNIDAGGFVGGKTAVIGGAGGMGNRGGVVPPIGNVAGSTSVMPGGMGGMKPAGTSVKSGGASYRADQQNGGSPKKTIGIVVGILAALAIVGALAFAFLGGGSGDPVPDVKGKTLEEATQIIRDAGFELGSTETKASDGVEEGKIIDQDPRAGTKHEKGTKINLTVSGGASKTSVPDLKGKTAEQARKLLEEAGLVAEPGKAEYSDEVEKDRVARQSIAAGEVVPKDTVVTYYLSLGSEGTEVPKVLGETQGSATTILNNAGFKVTSEEAYSDEVAVGCVISQTPQAGEKLKEDDTVHLVISKGPDPAKQEVSIPNLSGYTVGDAKARLEQLGVVVYVAYNMADTALVKSTDPGAGGTAKPGDTVTIYAENPPSGGGSGTGGGSTSGGGSASNNASGN